MAAADKAVSAQDSPAAAIAVSSKVVEAAAAVDRTITANVFTAASAKVDKAIRACG